MPIKRNWGVIIVKTFGILFGIGMFGFIVYVILLMGAFGMFDKTYDTDELVESFDDNRTEIYELKDYFNKIVPKDKNVAIEFEGYNGIARLDIFPKDTPGASDLTGSTDFNLRIGSKKADSLMNILGWNKDILSKIEHQLDKANCVYIESGEPTKIGFQRSGLTMYFFNVFDKPISDSTRMKFSDKCTYKYVNDKLILEFGGGAVGPQCFPN